MFGVWRTLSDGLAGEGGPDVTTDGAIAEQAAADVRGRYGLRVAEVPVAVASERPRTLVTEAYVLR